MRRIILLAFIAVTLSAISPIAASQSGPDVAEAARRVVEETNNFRRSERLSPVTPDKLLTDTSREFAEFMARTDQYGHEADGREPAQRAKAHGYDYCMISENIAYQFNSAGFNAPELVRGFVEGWKNSPGHRKNMLEGNVTETGVAIARSAKSGRYYAVQMFGRPKSLRTRFELSNRSPQTVSYELAGKNWPLPPLTTRMHEICTSAPIALSLPGESSPVTVRPANGERYVVERAGSRYRVSAASH